MSHITVIMTGVVVAAGSVTVYAAVTSRTTLMYVSNGTGLTALAIQEFAIGKYGWLPYFLLAAAALIWITTLVRTLRSRSKIA